MILTPSERVLPRTSILWVHRSSPITLIYYHRVPTRPRGCRSTKVERQNASIGALIFERRSFTVMGQENAVPVFGT